MVQRRRMKIAFTPRDIKCVRLRVAMFREACCLAAFYGFKISKAHGDQEAGPYLCHCAVWRVLLQEPPKDKIVAGRQLAGRLVGLTNGCFVTAKHHVSEESSFYLSLST